ncbi:MAG: hypothetical protein ACRC2U_13235 [Aeromonas sp.]
MPNSPTPADQWPTDHRQLEQLIAMVGNMTIGTPERLPTWSNTIHIWPATVGLGSGLLLPGPRRLQKLYAANYSNAVIYLHLRNLANLPANNSTIADRVYHVDPGSPMHLDRNFWDELGAITGTDSTSGLLFPDGLAIVPSPTRLNLTYFPGSINDLTIEISGSGS